MPNLPKYDPEVQGIALKTIGDIERELARLYRMAELGTLDTKIAIELSVLLKTAWQIKQDQRDNRYKLRLEALWREYQARLKAPKSQQALVSSSVVDITPVPKPESAQGQEPKQDQVQVPDKIND